ncbi:MAG: acetate--CoA ligase family protein [Hyphomicrobiales bacterium]|nr:acetate--CoA ligase family protein [Hyphomicrobiales bacterium]
MPFDIEKLLSPKSVAIVGASQRPGVAARRVINNLRKLGFGGEIYPVNPRYSEIDGERCYPSLGDLPTTPDAVFVAIAAEQTIPVIEEAGRCGIRAAIVNASGFADAGSASGEALQVRLRDAARASDIAICGPNNMGFINVHDRVCMWTAGALPRLNAGPAAVISHSGSVAIAISQDARDIGLAFVITAGNEAVCTAADYLRAVAADERVGVIMLFLETIRDPPQFAKAAAEAARRGKPIIALKVGRSEGGRAAVAAHTGALSGEDAVYDAFFRRHGIIRAVDIDEMVETAMLLSRYATPPESRRAIVVTVSGGEAALVNDLSGDLGLDLAELAPATLAAMRPAFPGFSRPRNPVDAWGLGWDAGRFKQIFDALSREPSAGVIALALDAPSGNGADAHVALDMAKICIEAAPGHDKKVVFLNNSAPGDVNRTVRDKLEPFGIPYLLGMRPSLAAIAHWLRLAPPSRMEGTEQLNLPNLGELGELERVALVAQAGVPFVECKPAHNADEAVQIAERWGFPVVLKGVASSLPHKTEHGLVKLGLSDSGAVRTAFTQLSAMLQRHAKGGEAAIIVQPMIEEGVQLLIGARNDPQFGSIVVVGLGGTLVEVMAETSLRIGPVDAASAAEMLEETKAATLIDGTRGKGPFDKDAAIDAIVALSRFAHATSGTVAAIEINPLIVRKIGQGALAVDLLLEVFEPRKREPAPLAAMNTGSQE